MKYISGASMADGNFKWGVREPDPIKEKYFGREPEDGVTLVFTSYHPTNRRDVLKGIATELKRHGIVWLRPVASVAGDWILDLDALKASFELLQSDEWLRGRTKLTPEYDIEEREVFGRIEKEAKVRFVVTPKELISVMASIDFPELAPFIERFQIDHPDQQRCAFLMMKYEKTPLHERIIGAVRETCSRHGIETLRADDKAYADELLANVRTYMHGCGFGIAVFERLTAEDFNPNVSLEVGYMMAQGKPICLLKDSTLASLHTDLVGRLYETFNTQNPEESVPSVLEKWLKDKEII